MTIRPLMKPAPLVASLFVVPGFSAGCSEKTGEAILVAKEYIAAGEEWERETPGQSPGPAETSAVQVRYSEGNYSGTVWNAEIVD